MLAHAQKLVYTLKELMSTQYQKDNLGVSHYTNLSFCAFKKNILF